MKIEIDIHSQKIEIVCAIFELSIETFIRSPKWMSMESRFESPQIAEKTQSILLEWELCHPEEIARKTTPSQ